MEQEQRVHMRPEGAAPRSTAREILRLAVPAFFALIAEPLFLLADSAIVGHLGVAELAGLGIATTVLQTAVGLMVFLAYGTGPSVARFLGAGKMGHAMSAARDGAWLALLLGLALAALGWLTAPAVVGLLGGPAEVRGYAVDYLVWSMPGLVGMLLVFAGTGALRGLQDTRTPLVVATVGFTGNILLNLLFVYGLGWGIAGSAIGTSIAQLGMAAAYLGIVLRRMRHEGVGLAPSRRGLLGAAHVGSWLMLRTLTLRAAIFAAVVVAAQQGPANLAAHQLAMTLFNVLAFALDALAIAAQALIGKELGAANASRARALTRTMVRWSLVYGAITGALLAACAPWIGWIFTPDRQVHEALLPALLVLAASQPVCGYVFVLDGVLIGAGDARYLALAGVLNLVVYAPLLVWAGLSGAGGPAGLMWLWAAFAGGYMLARALTLGLRSRADAWMVLGAH
ncbi:MATE family efflux transporter [Sinomonas atrocyanea]|jgi:putative MATE family efflux protein|uniref:MATE family efflux transporter n=1 Tax=Sinomonas atrocyanea TaxID=37927 RepID=UPI00277F0B49|nr:MATE family efflux transporter [Sinomonas atrocyanea]MDQ0260695.1 putative MATE family efflux protein [Sinomonas atrocyanea]MDR6622322.1 putative MATE family efflux protein [Sinomonas atrocyanea]